MPDCATVVIPHSRPGHPREHSGGAAQPSRPAAGRRAARHPAQHAAQHASTSLHVTALVTQPSSLPTEDQPARRNSGHTCAEYRGVEYATSVIASPVRAAAAHRRLGCRRERLQHRPRPPLPDTYGHTRAHPPTMPRTLPPRGNGSTSTPTTRNSRPRPSPLANRRAWCGRRPSGKGPRVAGPFGTRTNGAGGTNRYRSRTAQNVTRWCTPPRHRLRGDRLVGNSSRTIGSAEGCNTAFRACRGRVAYSSRCGAGVARLAWAV